MERNRECDRKEEKGRDREIRETKSSGSKEEGERVEGTKGG
jgi:hypothetical protein